MKLEITNRRENFHIYVKIIQHNSKQFTDQKKMFKKIHLQTNEIGNTAKQNL